MTRWMILSGLLALISMVIAWQKSRYYHAFCGMLYYLMTKYNDEPSNEKIEELIKLAKKHC